MARNIGPICCPAASAPRMPRLTQARLPMGVAEGQRLGLIDRILPIYSLNEPGAISEAAHRVADDPIFQMRRINKRRGREDDEARKPLEPYRAEELERLRLNFYGFDPSYHVARYNFIRKTPKSRTPSTLARHRATGPTQRLEQRHSSE